LRPRRSFSLQEQGHPGRGDQGPILWLLVVDWSVFKIGKNNFYSLIWYACYLMRGLFYSAQNLRRAFLKFFVLHCKNTLACYINASVIVVNSSVVGLAPG
jgi:hypothetical protein